MKNLTNKKKKVYTVFAGMLLVLLYLAIFCFSAQDGERSSAVSIRVTKALYKLYYGLIGYEGAGQAVEGAVILPLEGGIRKLGHFTEYLCVGFLSYSIAFLWMESRWKGCILIILQLFLSAGADELHQYFVPGRYASFWDVLLDVVGGIVGMLMFSCFIGIRSNYFKHKKE